jgi:CheY-like chemotaxis protein
VKKILLVDECPVLLGVLSDALVDTYDVVTASSGKEAIDLLEGTQGSGNNIEIQQFSVVVTDLCMSGVNGLDVADRVKKMNRYSRFTPVLLIGEEITKKEARAHGCSSMVRKENSDRIVSMIHILLDDEAQRAAESTNVAEGECLKNLSREIDLVREVEVPRECKDKNRLN